MEVQGRRGGGGGGEGEGREGKRGNSLWLDCIAHHTVNMHIPFGETPLTSINVLTYLRMYANANLRRI